ncbi:MAG: 16S rRNA processing protein RimM [Bacteroidetes bacterium]|nr:16S rRNA processing protein RimM [Bacteroidota bacterium]
MNPDEFFQVGKVVKSSGSSGELVFELDSSLLPKKKLESVFIRIKGNLIPFFIDSLRSKSSGQVYVKLLDVDEKEEIEELLGCSLFLPLSVKPAKKNASGFDLDLNGYKVIDENHGEIGFITSILELPMQELLQIDFNGKEILIPLVEEIVLKLDKKGKILHIRAPEGLIEIYL